MADREAINDVLADYAWANDAKDEGILKALFRNLGVKTLGLE